MRKNRSTFGSSTVLVSGGAGFIGSNFIHYILSGHGRAKVVNLDKLTYSGNLDNLKDIASDPRYKFIRGDIANRRALETVFKKYKPDYVINFAAETHVDRSIHVGSKKFVDTNVTGVMNILEAVKKYGCAKYVNVSTDEVYGQLPNPNDFKENLEKKWAKKQKFTEDSPFKPNVPYSACFDEDTEIFTEAGWKKYEDIKRSDFIGTLNLDTMKMEFQRVKEIFVYDFNGRLIQMRNRRLDLLVTPNHRVLFSWHRDSDGLVRGRFRPAKDLIRSTPTIQISAPIVDRDCIDMDYFVLPGCTKKELKEGKFVGVTVEEKKIPIIPWLRFLGWYLSEGSFQYNKNPNEMSGSYAVKLSTNYRRVEAVRVFRDIGFSKVYGKVYRKKKDAMVADKQLGSYVERFGKAKDKFIPKEIKRLPTDRLRVLLETLVDGDGHRRENRMEYVSVSKQLADDVQEIALKCGYSANMGRYKHFYRVNIIKKSRTVQVNQDKKRIKYIYYKGKVWCVSVKNENVFVRKNGKPFFSGNSKAAGDCLCNAYYHTWKVPVVITHCSNNYGPYQYPEKMIPYWMSRLMKGERVPVYGDGISIRDWIYVDDHIRALILCLLNGKPGETYNFGADNEKTNLQMVEMIVKAVKEISPGLLSEHWGNYIEFVTDRPGHDRRYAIDASKAKRELGWKTEIGAKRFYEKLKETIRWYVDNPEWIKNVRRRTGVFNPHIDLWKAHAKEVKR